MMTTTSAALAASPAASRFDWSRSTTTSLGLASLPMSLSTSSMPGSGSTV